MKADKPGVPGKPDTEGESDMGRPGRTGHSGGRLRAESSRGAESTSPPGARCRAALPVEVTASRAGMRVRVIGRGVRTSC